MSEMFLQDSCIYQRTKMYKDLLPLKQCSISPELTTNQLTQLTKSPGICFLTNLYPSTPLSLDNIIRQI